MLTRGRFPSEWGRLRPKGVANGVLGRGGKLRPYLDLLGTATVVRFMISTIGYIADNVVFIVLGILLLFLIGLGIHDAHSYSRIWVHL
jgi:hypothetical protein